MTASFWTRVKETIKSMGVTQEWVAKQAFINIRTFRGWVTKDIMPNADQAVAIGQVLGVSTEYLVRGEVRATASACLQDNAETHGSCAVDEPPPHTTTPWAPSSSYEGLPVNDPGGARTFCAHNVITSTEAAQLLGITKQMVSVKFRRGVLKALRDTPNGLLFYKPDIEEYKKLLETYYSVRKQAFGGEPG